MSAASPQAEPARTVLLTRSATQGAAFARALAEESPQNGLGEPRVLFAPLQQARTVEPGADHSAALEALASGHYAWVSFTSANTVRACAQLWDDEFARAVHAGGVRVACVGAATARAVHSQLGLNTDFQPQVQSAAGMLAEFEQPTTEPAAVLVLARRPQGPGLGQPPLRALRHGARRTGRTRRAEPQRRPRARTGEYSSTGQRGGNPRAGCNRGDRPLPPARPARRRPCVTA